MVAVLGLALPAAAVGQAVVSVPITRDAATAAAAAVRSAQEAGNPARVLAEARKWLEYYPNEPLVQSSILRTMAEAAAAGGDAALARQYDDASKIIDPAGAGRVEKAVEAGGSVRGQGNKLAKVTAAFSVALATLNAVAEAREQVRAASQAQMPPGGMPYPGAQMPPGAGAYPGGLPQAGGQMPPGGMAYPPAPYGAPGYQPPPAGYAPMPGYGPPPGGGMPQGMGAPSGYPPPGQMPPGQMPPGQMPAYPPQGYAMPADPYRPPPGYAMAPGYRGTAAPTFRVVHDHAVSSDTAHFALGCGALVTVEGSSIVFTPGGAEAPRVIPASDILQVRLNTAVGREVGAFHVLTREGLYLHLAPESGKPDDARIVVEGIRRATAGQ